MMLHLRLGDAMKNIPAHHGVQLKRPTTSTSTSASDGAAASKSRSKSNAEAGAGGAGWTGWSIPVLLTTAETGEGVDDLVGRLDHHAEWLESSGELVRRRRGRLEERVRDAVKQRLLVRTWREGPGDALLADSMAALERGTTTPYEVAARIVRASVG
jgi:LAO/AO transport system kinase